VVSYMKKYGYFFTVVLFVCVLFSVVDLRASLASTKNQKVYFLLNKAEVYSKKQGKHELALKMCNQAIKLQPGNLESYYRRAFIWGRKGSYVNAVKDFSIVIRKERRKKSRSFSHAPRFRADCYVALGCLQKAVDDYLFFLKDAPKDGKVWSYLVEVLARMKRNDLALQAVKKGLSTGSHWEGRLKKLQKKIILGEKIIPHRPLSN